MRWLWLGLVLCMAVRSAAAQSHLIVISGLGGEPKYSEAFHRWAVTLMDAAVDRYGLPESNVIYVAETIDRDPTRISARSTQENVERALTDVAQRAGPDDQVFIFLIGHGNVRDGEARLNLPGPDMTAADFAKLLEAFPSQKIIFVNTASASGDFIQALAGVNRAIITATKSGYERNETVFAEYFVQAFSEDGADIDKDERVSVLEAFNYARRETMRLYEAGDRLLTEHALLDDNADGEGSAEPDPRESDGQLAQSLFLVAATGTPESVNPASPELAALYREKQALEEQIAALRARKDELNAEAYEQQLEDLLVELIFKTRAIRELEGGGGGR